MLFFYIFQVFLWAYVLDVFVDGCQHARAIELCLILSLSVAQSADIFKLSLNLQSFTCLNGFEGDSYAKCEKSPDFNCLRGVYTSIIEALFALWSALRQGFR
jgi:hypothetical protein